MTDSTTIAALLTGKGRGAVATVLVRGPDAERLVRERFRNSLVEKSGFYRNKLYFGSWLWQDYSEELVVCRTDKDSFEVHCHGGNVASSRILDSLAEDAVRLSTQELVGSTFADRFMSRAIALLPNARTERVAALLLDQSRDAMRERLKEIHSALENEQLGAVGKQLDRLIDLGSIGARLDEPFSVVLVGRPNAGKSSLINAMLGYERAIVFDQPGTTRDLVRADTAFDGWPVRLVDTAGVRETENEIEREGVRMTKRMLDDCDLAIVVHDITSGLVPDPNELGLSKHQKRIVVGTKVDLLAKDDVDASNLDLVTSAETNQGVGDLNVLVAHRLVPAPPVAGEAIPLEPATLAALVEIRDSLKQRDIEQARSRVKTLLAS